MAGGAGVSGGRDLALGLDLEELTEGEPLSGQLDGEPVLVVRRGGEVHAVGATCTHWGGPLAEGSIVDETVRCPWHHACFSLRTGRAIGPPALNPLPRWEGRVQEGRVEFGERQLEAPLAARGRAAGGPDAIVILGAGAAGSAAAEALRREGYDRRVVLVDPDPDATCDRPNLSKDYLAGSAPEAWIPLRPPGFHESHGIERITARALSIDRARRTVRLSSGDDLPYGALLIATGSIPRRLDVPGAERDHVRTLRSLADSRRINAVAKSAERAVVVGAGFIGMEAAAALRARGLEVTIVAPDAVPFERTLGPDFGAELWRIHEENGVAFRLGHTVAAIGGDHVVLDDESRLAADLVIVGIGVDPDTRLSAAAGLRTGNGVRVDGQLRTSDPHIFAAGDIACFPDARTGEPTRVEHWVTAQQQGQAFARNVVGRYAPHADVPFFWTTHFGVQVSVVGYAARWDRVEIDGQASSGDAACRYLRDGQVLAVATIGRDRESLDASAAIARQLRMATERVS